jgi:hypothetical protein
MDLGIQPRQNDKQRLPGYRTGSGPRIVALYVPRVQYANATLYVSYGLQFAPLESVRQV